MKNCTVDQMCAPAPKPRLAMSVRAADTGVVATAVTGGIAAWAGTTVRKHAAFAARTTGLPAWSPPTC